MEEEFIFIFDEIEKLDDFEEAENTVNAFLKIILSSVGTLFSEASTDKTLISQNLLLENLLKVIIDKFFKKAKQFKKEVEQYEEDIALLKENLSNYNFENEVLKQKTQDLMSNLSTLQSLLNEADSQIYLLHKKVIYLLNENKRLSESLTSLEEREYEYLTSTTQASLMEEEKVEKTDFSNSIEEKYTHSDLFEKSVLMDKLNKMEDDLIKCCVHKEVLINKNRKLVELKDILINENALLKEENMNLKTLYEDNSEEISTNVSGPNSKVEFGNKNILTDKFSLFVKQESIGSARTGLSLINDILGSKLSRNPSESEKENKEPNRYCNTNSALLCCHENEKSKQENLKEHYLIKETSFTDLLEKEKVLLKWDEHDFPRLRSLSSKTWSSTSINDQFIVKTGSNTNLGSCKKTPLRMKTKNSIDIPEEERNAGTLNGPRMMKELSNQIDSQKSQPNSNQSLKRNLVLQKVDSQAFGLQIEKIVPKPSFKTFLLSLIMFLCLLPISIATVFFRYKRFCKGTELEKYNIRLLKRSSQSNNNE